VSNVADPFGQHSPTPATPAPAAADDADFDDDDFDDDDDEAGDDRDAAVEDDDDLEANVVRGARAAAVAEYVATAFADNPDAVEIETRERGHNDVSIYIHADRGDVGRLIGRRGRVINAIRQVARAAGAVDGERVQLDIAE
jgi:predicted RNA-binding protein YlqC (UPF0109 family)